VGAPQAAVVADTFTGLSGENRPRESLLLEAEFNAGNGDGLTVDAWVQSSADGGATWFDIANFHFTTASAKKLFHLSTDARHDAGDADRRLAKR
jgi:hypothetical protein